MYRNPIEGSLHISRLDFRLSLIMHLVTVSLSLKFPLMHTIVYSHFVLGLTTSKSKTGHFIALFNCPFIKHWLWHIVGTSQSLDSKEKFGYLSLGLFLGFFSWPDHRTKHSREILGLFTYLLKCSDFCPV